MQDHLARFTGNSARELGSDYQRLIRFFRCYSSTDLFLELLMGVISTLSADNRNLFLDGTEWKTGSFSLHVLVLAAQVQGYKALPFLFIFKCINTKGFSPKMNELSL